MKLYQGEDAVVGIELDDGEVVPANAVIVGAGIHPITEFLNGVPLLDDGSASSAAESFKQVSNISGTVFQVSSYSIIVVAFLMFKTLVCHRSIEVSPLLETTAAGLSAQR